MAGDLRGWLGHPRLTLPVAVAMALQIAQGMQHAVRKVPHLVHRDLKPGNILVNGDGKAMVTDFGLVHSAQSDAGTPAYMSPEQVKGQGNVDHRADLWALGCMAYECLIGRPVWNMDQGVAMTFASIATGPIPVPSSQRADLPPSFDEWFKKCLDRDPTKRFQGAKELADAFVEAFGQRPVSGASYPGVPIPSTHRGPAPLPGAPGAVVAQDAQGETTPMLAPPVAASTGRRGGDGVVNGGRGSVTSDAAMPLVTRASTDIPTTTSQHEVSQPPAKPSALRMGLAATFLLTGISLAVVVYVKVLGPQVSTPIVQSTAAPTASGTGSGPREAPIIDEPKWVPTLAEGQRLFSVGDIAAAHKKFKEAGDIGGPAAVNVAKVFTEQTKIAEKAGGPCKVAAFARPRIATERKADRPAIAPISKGALVTWVDDHERPGSYHAFGVVIDPTGKSISPIRDLTPDATEAARPQLAAVGSDRLVLVYWDDKGKEAGVRARLLDGTGNVDPLKGQVVRVGGTKSGQFWPAIDRGPEGFWVVWQDDRDKDGDHDLFVRHLSNDLDTLSAETRLTDYFSPPKSKWPPARVKYPSVAVSANTLLIAYKLDNEREKSHAIMRMRIPLADAEKGLDESKNPTRDDRVLGDVSMVSEDKIPADAPSIACGNDGCYVVWHVEAGGAMIAKIDPRENKVLWRKKLSDKGGRPSLGVNDGQVSAAWYEKPYIKFTVLNDAGPVLPPSFVFRIHEVTNPRPSISAGATKNEWYMTWQDSDQPKGTPEIYASRIVCR
jgi:serine/threonine-protein kinase